MVSNPDSIGIDHDGGIKFYILLENLPNSVLRQNNQSNWRPIKDLLYYIVSEVEPSTKRDNFTNCNVIPLHKCAVCEFSDPKLRQIAYDGVQFRSLRGSKLQAFLCHRRGRGVMEQTAGPIDPGTGQTRIANVPMITIGNEFFRKSPASCSTKLSGSCLATWRLLQAEFTTANSSRSVIGSAPSSVSSASSSEHYMESFSQTSLSALQSAPRPSSSSDTSTQSSCSDCSYLYSGLHLAQAPNGSYMWPSNARGMASPLLKDKEAYSNYPMTQMTDSNVIPMMPYFEIRIRSFNISLNVKDLEQYLKHDLGLSVHRVKLSGSSPTAYATFTNFVDADRAIQCLDNSTMFGCRLSVNFIGEVVRDDRVNPKYAYRSGGSLPRQCRPHVTATSYQTTPSRTISASGAQWNRPGPVIIDGSRD